MISGNVYKGLDGKAITDLVPGVEYFIDKTVGSNQVRLQRITGVRTAAGAVRLGVTGLGLVDGTYDLVLMYTR